MTQETAVEISDEVVEVFARILFPEDREEHLRESWKMDILRGLQAAIPLVVEGLVPSEKADSDNDRDPGMQNYRYGYNSCRRDILAKVKK